MNHTLKLVLTGLLVSLIVNCSSAPEPKETPKPSGCTVSGQPVELTNIHNAVVGTIQKKSDKTQIAGLGPGCASLLGNRLYMEAMNLDIADAVKKEGFEFVKTGDEIEVFSKKGTFGFAQGSPKAPKSTKDKIEKVAGIVKSYPDVKIKILGHASSEGKKSDNDSLAQKRADAAKDIMVKAGVNSSSIMNTTGMSSDKPLEGLKGPDKFNRRVDFKITP